MRTTGIFPAVSIMLRIWCSTRSLLRTSSTVHALKASAQSPPVRTNASPRAPDAAASARESCTVCSCDTSAGALRRDASVASFLPRSNACCFAGLARHEVGDHSLNIILFVAVQKSWLLFDTVEFIPFSIHSDNVLVGCLVVWLVGWL